jgi:dTDP-4-dehydrorhamnose 3,5-epimerase
MIDVAATELDGVLHLRPRAHIDERGFFVRTFDADAYAKVGIDANGFVQENQSRSRRGTLRGIHGNRRFQEAKLVRCARGAVFDVVLDLRPWSSSFGGWSATVLDDESYQQVYIPAGFGHGFCVLSDVADVCYKVDAPYDPADDLAIAWDDPELAIPWPVEEPLLSEVDRSAPRFRKVLPIVEAWSRDAVAVR